MNLQPNSFLQGDKYKIKRFINSGGFGCTYEAEHVMLQKRVAIKEFFVKDFCNRDEHTAHVTVGTQSKVGLVRKLRNKFIDEARALCMLEHKGIVHVTDVFEENGTAYFVMDYVDGPSLNDMVKRDGPMSEARALLYIRQVCDALEYVHNHNRLHLDIKPANIMIGKDNRAVLIDFGASKQYDESYGENTSTLMGKTPGYAPVEQMGNDVVKFLPATDIYALGATLYKLLTGITPVSSNKRASGEELVPLPAKVSQPTRKAVEAAMQVAKKNRPQSVAEFRKMLDNNNDDDEATVVVVDPVEEEGPAKSNRQRNIIIGVCIAVAVVGMGIFLMRGGSTPQEKPIVDSVTVADAPKKASKVSYTNASGQTFIYTGPVDSNGAPNGNGRGVYDVGTYEGEYVSGAREGKGKFTYKDGSNVFEGIFENDNYKTGRLTMPEDGSYFEGTFKNEDVYDGTWYRADGSIDYKVVSGNAQ